MSEAPTTAYAQSIAAAQELMNGVKKEQSELDSAEKERKAAKAAFRTAYEYWEEMQPVTNSADYFTLAATKCNERFNNAGQDRLAQLLLKAVFDWMEWKSVEEENGRLQ